MEMLKKYWYVLAGILVYFFMFNKKGKNVRRRASRKVYTTQRRFRRKTGFMRPRYKGLGSRSRNRR